MFDNLGTALVQALGFLAVFGFFIYQTLFADSKPKKGLFNRKSNSVKENLPVQKKGLFGRKKEVIKEEIKPKKKGWFK